MLLRSAYSYLCYIPDFGRVRSIYPNAAAPHKPPFDMTEFGLIDTIRDMFAAIPRNGFDGIGDDCTVFPLGSGESLVFTADLLAENIHFLRRATSARELGRKSLAVNLSDVAAMGARPIATLLSLAIPHDLPEGWIEDFMEGYRDLSAQYDVGLVGGDTTASDSGLVVNVTAIGRIADSHIKRRSDARPGDLIAVGGSLGESGAGPPAAKKCGFKDKGYICYEEDAQEGVVLRELLDKKLWNIPDRIKDKAQFEENLNQSIRQYNPEYWRARQSGRKAAEVARSTTPAKEAAR